MAVINNTQHFSRSVPETSVHKHFLRENRLYPLFTADFHEASGVFLSLSEDFEFFEVTRRVLHVRHQGTSVNHGTALRARSTTI